MKKKFKQKIAFFITILCIFGTPAVSDAAEGKYKPERRIFGLETVQRGYTFVNRDNTFKLGIFPNVFSEYISLKVSRIDEDQFVYPSNKKRVSDVFQYTANMKNPQILENPLAVSIAFENSSTNFKRIHFFDGTTDTWKPIPTSFDYSTNHARAYIHFPHVSLAVFEEEDYHPVKSRNEQLNIDSLTGAIIDAETGYVLYEKRGNDPVQIASITKLFTAHTALEIQNDFSRTVTISSLDYAYGALLGLRAGQKINYRDLIYATLVRSGNDGAKAVAHGAGLSISQFTKEMNAQARKNGLQKTHFDGVTGLESGNKSTAIEIARFAQRALNNFELLRATTTKNYCLRDVYGGHIGCYKNTNELLWSDLYITGGKTGYLPSSSGGIGSSLLSRVRLGNGKDVIVVALGNPSKSGRFGDVAAMAQWAERNYTWKK